MKELKDIVLKKGDIIYYINNSSEKSMLIVDGYDGCSIKDFETTAGVITKIERLVKYETIYEAPQPILDQKEKEYLEAVLRPFKDGVEYIEKRFYAGDFAYIHIDLDGDTISLPTFEKNKMYKGMEPNKEYTLDELGLFKE